MRTLSEIVKEAADEQGEEQYEVFIGLMTAGVLLGEKIITQFLNEVPERGEALWKRFEKFQGGDESVAFADFVVDSLPISKTEKNKLKDGF